MVHEPTLRKLHEMRLAAMADSYQNQLLDQNFQALSFEERFGLLVDTEWSRRKNNRLSALIRKADFQQSDACIENVEYHADRKLDRTQVLRLATGAYIQDNSILLLWVRRVQEKPTWLAPSALPPAGTSTRSNIYACPNC
jgi:DNA replication protein DnaC